jgi:hypothetical protein
VENGTCESCGTVGCDDLFTVQRLYVTPESWDREPTVIRVDDIERWCAACTAHYPHQLVSGGDGPAARP